MQRALPLLSVHRKFSFRARLLVALLALIQFIAPTWHVCAMGGASCCPPPSEGETKLHCPLPARSTSSTPRAASCCPQEEAAPQQFLNATPEPHGENCLAKLLLGMPWQSVAPLELVEFTARRTPSTPAVPRCIALADLPQPPSRGPPAFFV